MMRPIFSTRFGLATLQDYCVMLEKAEHRCAIASTKRRVKGRHDTSYGSGVGRLRLKVLARCGNACG